MAARKRRKRHRSREEIAAIEARRERRREDAVMRDRDEFGRFLPRAPEGFRNLRTPVQLERGEPIGLIAQETSLSWRSMEWTLATALVLRMARLEQDPGIGFGDNQVSSLFSVIGDYNAYSPLDADSLVAGLDKGPHGVTLVREADGTFSGLLGQHADVRMTRETLLRTVLRGLALLAETEDPRGIDTVANEMDPPGPPLVVTSGFDDLVSLVRSSETLEQLDPVHTTPAWFIDPTNSSGTASDTNTGLHREAPLENPLLYHEMVEPPVDLNALDWALLDSVPLTPGDTHADRDRQSQRSRRQRSSRARGRRT